MTDYVSRAGLDVAAILARFVEDRLLPGLSVTPDAFWSGFHGLVQDEASENRRLLAVRDEMQARIDAWLDERRSHDWDNAAWQAYLRDIGYLLPEGPEFQVDTTPCDPEVSSVAGPQLVVPVMNARFALNAANARWGSLYDALYGTDALAGAPAGQGYDAARGAQAVAWAATFLDDAVPLTAGSHADVADYAVHDGALVVTLADARVTGLADPQAFAGHSDAGQSDEGMRRIVLVHHGLHIILAFNATTPVGAASASGLSDVVLESALSAIQDCEDSVAAVDAQDKVVAYSNWLGLMKGDLTETFAKGDRQVTRRLNPDLHFTAPDGSSLTLPGRAMLLVRNVGLLMTTDAVLLDGNEIPEGLLDAMITVTAALHDLQKTEGPRNSRTGSIYVVKPKMHGPAEAAFADRVFARIETLLALPAGTVKVGLMDEERRTSANLRECIRSLKDRVFFINTGFLDRTGDEIHTVMHAGPVLPKSEMKDAAWLPAYEAGNVDAGLATGLNGKGQIGKGMWAMPDAMVAMLATKIEHPKAGATTAWVPSPTAATLHATHYHQVDVARVQADFATRTRASMDQLMTPPLMGSRNLSSDLIAREIDLNCQSILGYVVRWVDQGVGCSKVPDIDDVGLMEDRATLRISAQFLANWLMHGLISEDQIDDSLRRMAVAVDGQNADDPSYHPMAPACDGPAFTAARDLIVKGAAQPSGYTEPLLHAARRVVKGEADAS